MVAPKGISAEAKERLVSLVTEMHDSPAWQEALQLMRPGDEWILYVPSNLGYGEEGQGPIPPGAPLSFRIELIDVLPGPGRIQQG